MPFGSLAWEHIFLSLAVIWDLELACQLKWFCEHMLCLHLYIQLTCYLDWHFSITLSHLKDLWLKFHLLHLLDWWLVLNKDIWLAYHWGFHLDPHLNQFPNPGGDLTGMLLGAPLGLWFGSELFRCGCCENISNKFQIYFETHFLLLKTLLDRNKLNSSLSCRTQSAKRILDK